MEKIIYVPLEHIDSRYTIHMDRDIMSYLIRNNYDFIRIPTPFTIDKAPKGMFLDAANTIKTKSYQMQEIAKLYEEGKVTNETKFFFSDIWFPGIESLAYLNYFYKVNPKITGIIHAGSFTDTDFVRDMERWAKNFEDVVFDIATEIYCASEFIKNDIIKKRLVDPKKLKVTSLPLDSTLSQYHNDKKENIIIFNGRLCDEKQPWMFDRLKEVFNDLGERVEFIKTQELNLSKDEYYKLLAKSKVVVSYALQENFGFGVNEAVSLGCVPVLPNKLVYPEIYPKEYLFDSFDESVLLTIDAVRGFLKPITIDFNNSIEAWFE
jgi:glycosyltransferase involved in cell wall biosynthesis